MTRVFVYGTLLRGESNHRLLARSTFVGRARTVNGYRLHDLGSFPAMVVGGQGAVEGELYEVDAEVLAALDRLEGHPTFYRRVEVELEGGGSVETYVMERSRIEGCALLPGGSWRGATVA